MVKSQGSPFNINIIQAYTPTQDFDDDEQEQFYDEIQQAIECSKSGEILCVMGEMSAKVGSTAYTNVVRKFGVGDINNRGERLIQFCEQNKLMIASTWFQHPPRKLYTWKSPGGARRNQTDYTWISQRFRIAIKQAKTQPGADINSDHNLVKTKLRIKLKKLEKAKTREQLDLGLMKQQEHQERCSIVIKSKFELSNIGETPQQPEPQPKEEQWQHIKTYINETLKTTLPEKPKGKKQAWMTKWNVRGGN